MEQNWGRKNTANDVTALLASLLLSLPWTPACLNQGQFAQEGADSFECKVSIMHSMPMPGEQEPEPIFGCHLIGPLAQSSAPYTFAGNPRNFFSNVDTQTNFIKLTVPKSAVGPDAKIRLSDEILVSVIPIPKTLLATRASGEKSVLIIRVSDDTGDSELRRVKHSANALSAGWFGSDNNNLSTLYEACSAGKLEFAPLAGPDVQDGVIDIGVPNNVCNMNHVQVKNWAMAHPKVIAVKNSGIDEDTTHYAIVMPNGDCIGFGGGAAWGQVHGNTTWYQGRFANYPVTQVHELGHNLGLRHSGATTSSGFKAYADPTCYMGNRANWNDDGSKMCFNAAKTFFLGWYADQHSKLPTNVGETTTRDLVGIDDVKNGRDTTGAHVVLEIPVGSTTLFATFNRAIGVNAEVADHADTIVITEQAGPSQESSLKAALKAGDAYQHPGSPGKTLVLKNDGIDYGNGDTEADRARFTLRVVDDGGPGQPGGECRDRTQSSGDPWYDSDGPTYDCQWYASQSTRCTMYGGSYANFGYSANSACCACGGGVRGPVEPICGNGIVEGTEACDDGAQNGQPNHCNSMCSGTTPPICGNGVLENTETCDDGAQNGQPNHCNSSCSGMTPPICGNGIVEDTETCDDGAQNGQPNHCNSSCSGMTPSDRCERWCANHEKPWSTRCTWAACGACVACGSDPFCGNGIVEDGETCDDGNDNGRTNFCNKTCSGQTVTRCENWCANHKNSEGETTTWEMRCTWAACGACSACQ